MMHPHLRLISTPTVLILLGAFAFAADPLEEAIKADRKLIEGTWRVVTLEVNGSIADEADARKLSVVDSSDGTWTLYSEGNEVAKGTTTFNPLEKPKTINFTISHGENAGTDFHGIYELNENTRKICVAPTDVSRPMDFYSAPGSQQIFIKFEREPPR